MLVSKNKATFIAVNIVLAALYFLAGKTGLLLAFVNPSATPVWPPTGIALAAILVLGYRVWPGVFAGAFLVNWTTAGTPLTAASIALGNTLEGLLGAYLVSRFANGTRAFDRSQDIFRFAAIGALPTPILSATAGTATLLFAGNASWSDTTAIWLTWWMGDAVGALVVAPMLVLWSRSLQFFQRPHRPIETAILLALLVLISQAVFGDWHPFLQNDYPLEFLTIPVLIWAAFRIGQPMTATFVLVLSSMAIVGTLRGFGAFAEETKAESLLLLQAFMGTISISSMTLAAVVSERRQAIEGLRRSATLATVAEERLKQQIAELLHGRVQTRLMMAWNRLAECDQLWNSDPKEARALLNQVRDEIDSIREQEIRQASHMLHPAFIREGLGPAVDALVERFDGHLDITVSVEPSLAQLDTPVRSRLPEELRLAAFRIVEEALNNVLRHAEATAVHIQLGVEAQRWLTVSVTDDGRGFNEDEMSMGLGLGSIDSRVLQIGGEWTITSQPARGTTLAAKLLLKPALVSSN